MKHIKFLGVLIILFGLLACGSKKNKDIQDSAYSGWNFYETNDYQIQYPQNWRLDTSGYRGTVFSIFSQQTSLLDKFIENVNLIIYDISDTELDYSEYIELTEKKIKANAVDSLLIESERIRTSDADFLQKIIYTKRDGIYILKFEKYYWLKNNTAYELTFTCKTNEFKNYQETGEYILNSFKIKLN